MQVIFDLLARHWLLVSVALLAAITAASLAPLPQLPSISGGDKTHHLVSYAILAIPVALRRPKYWLAIVIAFAIWSGAIELIQPYVDRYAEWMDLFANCLGLMLGVAGGEWLRRMIRR